MGYWALSAVTGITVQDFYNVNYIEAVKSSLVFSQVEKCLSAFPVKAVKVGAVCSLENIQMIAECFKKFKIDNIVLDTVLSSSSGMKFLDRSSLDVIKKELFPLATIITPNKPEFEILSNEKFSTIDEGVAIAVEKCKEWDTAILLKGGHFENKIIEEALISDEGVLRFQRGRSHFKYQHGTGCTLSSALACFMGNGLSLENSYKQASGYLLKHYDLLQNKLQ